MKKEFWTGYNKGTITDWINHILVSNGSPMYTQQGGYASYNGKSVTLSFNERRQYWIGEFYWAGREVIVRGDFKTALAACLQFHKNDGAFGVLRVTCETAEQVEICALSGLKPHTAEIANKAWSEILPEWAVDEASALCWMQRHSGGVDFSILVKAVNHGWTEEQYRVEKDKQRPADRKGIFS